MKKNLKQRNYERDRQNLAFPLMGSDGLTKRDYFAAQAISGMCASFPNVIQSNLEHFIQTMPQTAYGIADAMLEARKK